MSKKTKKIIFAIVMVLILLIGVIIGKLYVDGFKFYTYSTENLIQEQIESIIKIDTGKSYDGKVKEVSVKEINDSYLAFFSIEEDSEDQCIIAKYNKGFSFGKHKVLNLDKIIKSSNSVAMMELLDDNDEYIILISTESGKYESINIVSGSDNEVLETIELTDEGIESKGGEKLSNEIYLLGYKNNDRKEIGIELVKKSEE